MHFPQARSIVAGIKDLCLVDVSKRYLGLDILRSCAIILVMLHHFRHLPDCPEWLKWFALRGYAGVDLFFVLSGYLICSQLLRGHRETGKIDFKKFWGRRWLRIFPSYLTVLFLMVLGPELSAMQAGSMLVFAQNYLNPRSWLTSWSLCVEEHFYLAIPLLMALILPLARKSRVPMLVFISAVMGVSPILRWFSFNEMSQGSYSSFISNYYVVTHLRLDGLAIGVALSLAAHYRSRLWSLMQTYSKPLFALGLVLIATNWLPALCGAGSAGADRMRFFPFVLGFLATSLGTGLLVPRLVAWRSDGQQGLFWALVSEHAFALYLVHEPARNWASELLPGHGFLMNLAGAFIISMALAFLLRTFVERPFLLLRRAFDS